MRRFLSYTRFLALAAFLLLSGACGKSFRPDDLIIDKDNPMYVNLFAYNMMKGYYLWADEVEEALGNWAMDEPDPVAKVESLRYRDADGKLVDRWTKLYEDFDSFYDYVSGTRKSFGFDCKFYYANEEKTRVVAAILYTYAGGPAREAGLKRGDSIWEVNGKALTPDNYARIFNEEIFSGDQVTLTMLDGTKETLTSVEMYENPIQLATVFDRGGRKVGYLHFTSFTLDCWQELVDIFKDFKAQGIRDLILDVRYNGGGYALTEGFLASMLVPEADVTAGNVLSTEIYNSWLSEIYGVHKILLKTEHVREVDGKDKVFSTQGANPGISHLYAIVESSSASATEALIEDLYPYLPVTVVGRQTSGKYCAGQMRRATEWYEMNAEQLGNLAVGKNHVAGWGIYVMYARFADRDGVTRCMPDGLKPDYVVRDSPADGYQLGDPRETMLAATLALIDGVAPVSAQSFVPRSAPEELPLERPTFRIVTPETR